MSHAYTPRGYASQIRKYPMGDPRRTVAAMRATLATEAASAAREGDYGRSARALNGLHRLAGFGALDIPTLRDRIASSRGVATGTLSTNAAAVARNQASATRISGIIALIAPLASGISGLLAAAINTPESRAVGRWLQLLIDGRFNSAAFTESEVRAVRAFCSTSNTVTSVVQQVTGVVMGVIQALAIASNANERTSADIELATQIINELVAWITSALNTICSEVTAVVPDASACAGAAGRPTGGEAGCCPGLIYRADIDRCVTALPSEPTARAQWTRAVDARRNVEAVLANPEAFTAAAVADAQARDGTTAFDMCEAEKALLLAMATTPQRGAPPPESTIVGVADRMAKVRAGTATGADRAALALGLAAMFNYLPPSSKARCYIILPPTGGCPAGCGANTGGGAGAIVALALPAAAFAWYMMK